MTDEKTAQFRTFCGPCVFKKTGKNGRQTGCEFGRVKKFKALGTKVEYDKETKSQIIHRFCSACRNQEWADKQDDTIRAVRKEMEVQFDIIITVNPDESYEEAAENVIFSITDCFLQTIKPKSIVVVTNNKAIEKKVGSFVNDVVAPLFKDSGVKYAVVRSMVNHDDVLGLVDDGFPRCRHMYYTSITAMKVRLPYDMIEKVDYAVNDLLWPVLMVTNNSATLYPNVYMRSVHKLLGGNVNAPLHQKIDELAKDQENEHAVHYWSELCQSK